MSNLLRSLSEARQRRREARIRELEQQRAAREEAVMTRVPRLGEIKSELAQLGLALTRLALRSANEVRNALPELNARRQALTAERDQLMQQHGIDPRHLEVHWDCPECQNTGWVTAPVTPEQDTALPARKCHCLLAEELEDLFRFSGLTPPLREQTFANFRLDVYPAAERDYMLQLQEDCRQFAQTVAAGEGTDNLLLMGGFGLGKTFLATAIANHVVAQRKVGIYFTFPEFLDVLRRQRFDDESGAWPEAQRLLLADLLVLDDLGTEKLSEWAAQELFSIVNHRVIRHLPMVFVTNLTLPELREWYGERIFSRLVGSAQILEFRGVDIRLSRRLHSGLTNRGG